jgi:hypothetical protein
MSIIFLSFFSALSRNEEKELNISRVKMRFKICRYYCDVDTDLKSNVFLLDNFILWNAISNFTPTMRQALHNLKVCFL